MQEVYCPIKEVPLLSMEMETPSLLAIIMSKRNLDLMTQVSPFSRFFTGTLRAGENHDRVGFINKRPDSTCMRLANSITQIIDLANASGGYCNSYCHVPHKELE